MIYDPSRRALELRQRILENMTAEEIEDYVRKTTPDETAVTDVLPESPAPETQRHA